MTALDALLAFAAAPRFAFPWALLLAPLPLLMLRHGPRLRASGAAMIAPEGVRGLAGSAPAAALVRGAARALPWVAWLCLLLALAGPRALVGAAGAPPSGRDLMLVVDLSGSMERADFLMGGQPAARIDVVREMGADFVRGRAGDRVGLIVFGDQAYVAAAPSFDVEAVAQTVEGMAIGIAGRSTAISDGLGLALKRMGESDAASRVMILLSDGTNTAGSVQPEDAAELAAGMGVRIHTIAFGPLALGEGSTDRNAVDDVTLAAIAEASGGVAFRVRDGDDFAAVHRALDALETSAGRPPQTAIWADLWMWPGAVALLAALGRLWSGAA
jgi:Ca-activated chloride channel family protein